jgi:hypothetical protein
MTERIGTLPPRGTQRTYVYAQDKKAGTSESLTIHGLNPKEVIALLNKAVDEAKHAANVAAGQS